MENKVRLALEAMDVRDLILLAGRSGPRREGPVLGKGQQADLPR
jgi:hypothetical protein